MPYRVYTIVLEKGCILNLYIIEPQRIQHNADRRECHTCRSIHRIHCDTYAEEVEHSCCKRYAECVVGKRPEKSHAYKTAVESRQTQGTWKKAKVVVHNGNGSDFVCHICASSHGDTYISTCKSL